MCSDFSGLGMLVRNQPAYGIGSKHLKYRTSSCWLSPLLYVSLCAVTFRDLIFAVLIQAKLPEQVTGSFAWSGLQGQEDMGSPGGILPEGGCGIRPVGGILGVF